MDDQAPIGDRKKYLLSNSEQFARFMSLTAGGKTGRGFKGMKPQFAGASVGRDVSINIDGFLKNTIANGPYKGLNLEKVIGKERADRLRAMAVKVRESQQRAVNTGFSTGGVIYGQAGRFIQRLPLVTATHLVAGRTGSAAQRHRRLGLGVPGQSCPPDPRTRWLRPGRTRGPSRLFPAVSPAGIPRRRPGLPDRAPGGGPGGHGGARGRALGRLGRPRH